MLKQAFAVMAMGVGLFSAEALAISCSVVSVETSETYVSIQCSTVTQVPPVTGPGYDNVRYFAIPTVGASYTDRIITMALLAVQLKVPLNITFDANSSHNPTSGCSPSNCRAIQTLSIGP